MAPETKFLAEYIHGPYDSEAPQAFGYTPDTYVRVTGFNSTEYRFGALAGPQFTAAEQLVAVYLSASSLGGSVRIEVRQPKDFPWVAALLSARVKRLDPGFNPSMIQSLKPEQTPRLVLTPAP